MERLKCNVSRCWRATARSCESASRGELNEGAVGGESSVGAQVRERVVANLLFAAATASKLLAVMAAMASERLAVTEAMSSE